MGRKEMNMRNIAFSPPDIGTSEIEEVCKALRSGWITTGPRTKRLEEELRLFSGADGMVCLNSATAAEELTLRLLGIREGDEVLVPAYTYTATASAALHTGATVKLIDSRPGSWEMDYEQMAAAVTERTKAVVPVDLGGMVCDYEKIYQVLEEKKALFQPSNELQEALGRVAVVADCAHALGARRYGKVAGAIADFSCFSFHAVKNLTTAEGGAACWKHISGIEDEELYQKFQLMSLHGQSKDALAKMKAGAWEYDIVAPYYKCNMTDIMAALGQKQLERYPGMQKRRREIIEMYDEMCGRLGIFHLKHYEGDRISSGHLYLTRIPWADSRMRGDMITELARRGIACNVHYKPLPMMTAYKNLGYDIQDFPNAYDYFVNEITLPLHTKLTDEDVGYVMEQFEDVVWNTIQVL
jgi:dTDP-4-amino-4,6-dideoxygalactose transaminase